MDRFCRHCGAPIDQLMNYCRYCGLLLRIDQPTSLIAPKNSHKAKARRMHQAAVGLLVIVLVAALGIIALDLFGVLNLSRQKKNNQKPVVSIAEQLGQIAVPSIQAGPDSSDAPKVRQEIDDRLKKLSTHLREHDIEKCMTYFDKSVQENYGRLFAEYPEIMPEMAELLGQGELSALSFPENATADSKRRTAEYRIAIDGFSFYFVLIEVDDIWYMLDI